MFVQAVANPMKSGKQPEALHDRMPGYGIVRFDKRALKLRFECWPRWARKADGDAAPPTRVFGPKPLRPRYVAHRRWTS
jgi:hypothetical protein